MSAHAITVVSPTYAREIMSPRQGMGLEGVINVRHDDVAGIVNGIDSSNPYIRAPLRKGVQTVRPNTAPQTTSSCVPAVVDERTRRLF
ncbi:Glycogen synthase [Ensifer sesbaniae]|nr:Glycogen synthase [Ensifer sesbaniae]